MHMIVIATQVQQDELTTCLLLSCVTLFVILLVTVPRYRNIQQSRRSSQSYAALQKLTEVSVGSTAERGAQSFDFLQEAATAT